MAPAGERPVAFGMPRAVGGGARGRGYRERKPRMPHREGYREGASREGVPRLRTEMPTGRALREGVPTGLPRGLTGLTENAYREDLPRVRTARAYRDCLPGGPTETAYREAYRDRAPVNVTPRAGPPRAYREGPSRPP